MPTLYVGTNGLSIWTSKDGGENINRSPSSVGIYSGSQTWSFAIHPTNPRVMLAGTDNGLYRLDPDKKFWNHIKSPMDEALFVTAIAYHPKNPDIIVCGTQPAGLYRSTDGGKSWTILYEGMKPYITTGFFAGEGAANPTQQGDFDVKHWARVTGIAFDQVNPNIVCAGVEIDGVWRSTDAGASWTRSNEGFETDDIHGFGAFVNGKSNFWATTNRGLYSSDDGGLHWQIHPLESKSQYVRTIVERQDGSGTLFVTNGNGPPGTWGKLFRSRDHGKTWENVTLPGELESSLYFLAVHPSDPKLIFAAANLGQLYRSSDGGESWSAIKRRLPEVRALAWLPD